MLFTAHRISYQQTNYFSKIVTDYLANEASLQPFFALPPTFDGIRQAIAQKELRPMDRAVLVQALQKQYSGIGTSAAVAKNIEALSSENTFTICTAHQPNLFTGPLYFIYKILHAIKLAAHLKEELPQYNFVPVYYMGSEDADLEELNHTYVRGKKYEWTTGQTGAVGRMVIDKKLTALLAEMESQLSVDPHGSEIAGLFKECYTEGKTIQQATFEIVNRLFQQYGLVVLIPDSADLKRRMLDVFKDDLFHQLPSAVVGHTSRMLGEKYDVQAHPRDINLFYLKGDRRERIIKQGEGFTVNHTDIRFSAHEMEAELQVHPERFSPNVILRGLFQETILPNLVFIGGGGELAYWLQFRDLFDHYRTPFPVLVLRNSFLLLEKKWQELAGKLGLSDEQLFLTEQRLLDLLIEREGKKPLLNGEVQELANIYEQLKSLATSVDQTLSQHVEALKTKATNQLVELEKKMVRAERKKHASQQAQISKLKRALFPSGLQERTENIAGYYALWGKELITQLYEHSFALEQEFVILKSEA
jgi:bacillithiol biosynthesis cysteine-adding enzyme BshC